MSYEACPRCKGLILKGRSNCPKCGGEGRIWLQSSSDCISENSSRPAKKGCAKCRDSEIVFDRGRASCDCQAVDDGNDPNWG
jgi:RecJ-like exonuclease